MSSSTFSVWSFLKPQITSQPCQARPGDEDMKPLPWSDCPNVPCFTRLTDDNQHVNLTTFHAENLKSFPPSEGFLKKKCIKNYLWTNQCIATWAGRYLLRLWLVVDWQIWRQKRQRDLICSSELLSSSPHTAGRADLVKWALEDFQSKLDIMQPRVSWMVSDCKEQGPAEVLQGPAAHKSQNMSGHFFLWYSAGSKRRPSWMFGV